VGLIGAGNMARALARGWGEPILCSDGGSGRAQELVAEVGGEALSSNREVAERADLVVLCHKPYQLDQVAGEIAGTAKAVASVLGGVSTGLLQQAYPDTPVFALQPNTPVEIRRGVIVYAERPLTGAANHPPADPDLEPMVLELFGRLGTVVRLPEALVEVASTLSAVGPAYEALLTEAQVDAGVRRGLPAALASQLVVETMAGTAALLAHRGYDTLAVRREVTSPGGVTARGLAALEKAGIRGAFQNAIDAIVP
ncbi:MAG TPA: pyrroline-5-carboxylate reductase, partial [Solirubrobacteraceae bacterium]|nr:pyrroline-5-carboxylate reductase [Solirubrobacteraceae bacterium]